MTVAIETASTATTAGTLPGVESVAQLAETIKSLSSLPDVIVTLGTTPTPPLTYTATGLFESLFQVTDAFINTSNSASAAAKNNSGTPAVAGSRAQTESLSPVATAGAPNASIARQSLPASPAASLTPLLTQDFNPASVERLDTLTVNQALARQIAISPNTAAAPDNVGTTTSTTANSTVTATTTTTATTATAGNADSTPNSTGALLAGVRPALPSTKVVGDGIVNTAVNAGGANSAIPVAAEPATTPAGIIATAPVTTAPATSNTVTLAETTSTANLPAATDATLTNFLVDSGALARANITANPAYASAVASFYVSLATPIREPASADSLPNRMESVQPITAVSAASAIAQYSGQSSRDMNGRKPPNANTAARRL